MSATDACSATNLPAQFRRAILLSLPLFTGLAWSGLAVVIMARSRTVWLTGYGGVAAQAVGVVLLVLPLMFVGTQPHLLRRAVPAALIQLMLALVVFGLISLVAVDRPNTLVGLMIFVAAAAEELAFRVLLPWYMAERLRNEGLPSVTAIGLGIGVAQLSFALAHHIVTPLAPYEFVRLLAAGLLFAELVSVLGLGFVAVLHGTLNYVVAFGSLSGARSSPILVSAALVVGLALLYTRGTAARNYGDLGSTPFVKKVGGGFNRWNSLRRSVVPRRV